MPPESRAGIKARLKWIELARPNQLPPPGDDWFGWLAQAGRGFGKTRIGAEETAARAIWNPGWRIAVVAPTRDDLKKVCFEGESGLLNVIPKECLFGGSEATAYNRTDMTLLLWNGTQIFGFSAEKPARLRGPQFHFAWCDELAGWLAARMKETWDMLMFGLRLGDHPQVVVTSTPKPLPLVIELNKRVGVDFKLSSGSTYENRSNLAKTFFDQLTQYEGTALGDQEIHAKVLDLSANAILKRPWWRRWLLPEPPVIEGYVLSLDTAFKEGMDNDCSALTVWGFWQPADAKGYHAILCRAWREKLSYPDLRERVQKEHKEFAGRGLPTICLIEDKASGISLIQELSRGNVPVHPYNPGNADKVMRAHLASDVLKSGRLWALGRMQEDGTRSLEEFTAYAEQVVEECELFPLGEYADLVDTVTQAIAYLRDFGGFVLPSDDTEEDDEDAPKKKRRGSRYP